MNVSPFPRSVAIVSVKAYEGMTRYGDIARAINGLRSPQAPQDYMRLFIFPAQWLYGLLRALPGERLFCLRRHERSVASPGLNASTAAPEPHDLAVRFRRYVYRAISVHRISPRVRDVRERPSSA